MAIVIFDLGVRRGPMSAVNTAELQWIDFTKSGVVSYGFKDGTEDKSQTRHLNSAERRTIAGTRMTKITDSFFVDFRRVASIRYFPTEASTRGHHKKRPAIRIWFKRGELYLPNKLVNDTVLDFILKKME